jgi:eukaryotic-like serine/threonine-protein kinase
MEHPYCYYSFELLDPQNPDPALRSFVRCTNCGKTYHEKYWLELKRCLNCQQAESTPLPDVSPITRPNPVLKSPLQAIPTRQVWAGSWYENPRNQLVMASILLLLALTGMTILITRWVNARQASQHAAATATMRSVMTQQWRQTETARPTSTPTLTFTPTLTPTLTFTPTRTPTSTPIPGPGSFIISNRDGMRMYYVPKGVFTMGSKEGTESERPEHQVELDAYWIYETEVTNGMYALCVTAKGVTAKGCTAKTDISAPGHPDYYVNPLYKNYPVFKLTWEDARNYCEWAGNRLPTEAEWEKAARGTEARTYPWGKDMISTNLNYADKKGSTTEVGSFPLGASPYLILDMAGNVWEWVNDWYDSDYYRNSPKQNPLGPTTPGNGHVIRGGGWSSSEKDVRMYHRANQDSAKAGPGFRCVISAGP